MLDVVRQYVDAALGALPKDRAVELASGLIEAVRTEVRRQVGALGLATKEDLDEVRQRLWKLEGAAAPAERAVRKPSPARGTGTKRAPAKGS